MQKLKIQLKQKLENAGKVAVLGIGSELRGDDVAGIMAAEQIERISRPKTTTPELKVFIGQTAPENLTGEIKKFRPTHLIIIDAADLDGQPGKIVLIEPENVGGVSFCTHSLPTKVMTDYLLQSFNLQIIIIGIQPKTLAVGALPSKEVTAAAKLLSETIVKILNKA